MTPAQIRAALQKAQRDQKRAIDNYNREMRKHNAAVKKAANDYNREVRNYNSKARVHNREVENQRRRLQQEIARLNSRSSRTSFVTYRASTRTFVEIYDRAEAGFASGPSSAADRRLLNLVSDEAANSVYLANALDGDGDPAGSFTGRAACAQHAIRARSLGRSRSPRTGSTPLLAQAITHTRASSSLSMERL